MPVLFFVVKSQGVLLYEGDINKEIVSSKFVSKYKRASHCGEAPVFSSFLTVAIIIGEYAICSGINTLQMNVFIIVKSGFQGSGI